MHFESTAKYKHWQVREKQTVCLSSCKTEVLAHATISQHVSVTASGLPQPLYACSMCSNLMTKLADTALCVHVSHPHTPLNMLFKRHNVIIRLLVLYKEALVPHLNIFTCAVCNLFSLIINHENSCHCMLYFIYKENNPTLGLHHIALHDVQVKKQVNQNDIKLV